MNPTHVVLGLLLIIYASASSYLSVIVNKFSRSENRMPLLARLICVLVVVPVVSSLLIKYASTLEYFSRIWWGCQFEFYWIGMSTVLFISLVVALFRVFYKTLVSRNKHHESVVKSLQSFVWVLIFQGLLYSFSGVFVLILTGELYKKYSHCIF